MVPLKRRRRPDRGARRTVSAWGVAVTVELDRADRWGQLDWLLPPGALAVDAVPAGTARFTLVPEPGELWSLRLDDTPFVEHVGLEVAVQALDQQLRLHVAARAPGVVFVHAGVVARAGRVLLLPGASFSGKTTLVAALVRAGATYFSDEYAVIDADGSVHPYPRPLSLRGPDGDRLREAPAGELGAAVAGPGETARIGLVAITRFRPGAVWSPRPRSRGEGVVALMANTVPARDRPAETLAALGAAVGDAVVLASDRGEAAATADALLSALDRSGVPGGPGAGAAGRVRR